MSASEDRPAAPASRYLYGLLRPWLCENVYGAKIVRILFPHAAGPATPSTHCTRKACREPRARSAGTTGFSRFLAWGAGGHRDVSLAREGKNIWRLRTPFYCAAARERFRMAKTRTGTRCCDAAIARAAYQDHLIVCSPYRR